MYQRVTTLALGIEQRQPPPPRGHTPHLDQASVRRNLSQFELDDVGMEDAPGVTVIEAGPEADLDRGTARGPLEGLIFMATSFILMLIPNTCFSLPSHTFS
jgi:hypothetical protein